MRRRDWLPDGVRKVFHLPPGPARIARVARDVDDEIAFHLAMKEDRLRATGMSEDDARRAARQRFGDTSRYAGECRAIAGSYQRRLALGDVMTSLWQDARYAARSLVRTPSFSVAALLTLTLGIGATTAVFALVHGVLLRPLPYREPDRLVHLWETNTSTPGERNPVSVPNYRDWVRESRSFSSSLAVAFNRFTLSGDGEPEQLQGLQVWGDMSAVLGVRPILGRAVRADDERADVVVLGEGLWRRRFSADVGMVGRAVRLNGRPHTVIGVMPASFQFPRPGVELWTAYASVLENPVWAEQRGRRFQRVVARLRDDVTAERARADIDAVARRLAAQYPDANEGGGATLVPLHEQLVGDIRPALLVLAGAVACVLLIACANVAHLLLARTTARHRELAVRAALGAGRGRIVRLLLTESAVLAAAGAAGGLVLAHVAVGALRRFGPESLPRLDEVHVGWWTVAFSVVVALVAGMLAGLVPVLDARRQIGAVSRYAAPRKLRVQSLLVATEVAAALVLLVSAGLLLESYARLSRVTPGVDPSGVLTALVMGAPAKYGDADRQRVLFDRIVQEVAATPGVEAVGLCDCLPPDQVRQGGGLLVHGVEVQGPLPVVEQTRVAASYFGALRIPIVAGRAIGAEDRVNTLPVAVVNETLARRHLVRNGPLSAAIGRRISMTDTSRWLTVVGVAADVHYAGLAAPVEPAMYYAFAQDPMGGMNLFVRTAGDPLRLTRAVAHAVQRVDAEIPLARVASLEQALDDSIAQQRLNRSLLGVFAALAATLAAIGIYGVVAYGIASRRRELGVRLALGARTDQVIRFTIVRGLRPVIAGTLVGLVVASFTASLLGRVLFATDPHDATTYAAVALLFLAVAAIAAYAPARRITAFAPAETLRAEQ